MTEKAKSFKDLIVWQKAHEFVLEIYRLTHAFPKSETFGLTAQIRRSAVSIPANIAEGFKRISQKDKLRIFNIAQASLEETRYYLILVNELSYVDTASLLDMIEQISKQLEALMRSIRKSIE